MSSNSKDMDMKINLKLLIHQYMDYCWRKLPELVNEMLVLLFNSLLKSKIVN